MDRESRNTNAVESPRLATANLVPSRARLLLGSLFLILFAYPFFKYGLFETWHYTGFDWGIYYRAARDLRSGESPYPPEVLNQSNTERRASAWNKYMYPPLFARLLAPLTWFSDLWAKRVYQIVCCAFYLYLLLPRGGIGQSQMPNLGEWIGRWLAIAFVLGWGPSVETIRLGQANLFPLFLIAAACRLLPPEPSPKEGTAWSRRELVAGLCLGIASAVKLTPLVILPVLVVTLRFRAALGMVLGFACAMILPGLRTCWQYVTLVVPTFSQFPRNQEAYTLSSWLARWDGTSAAAFPMAVFFFTSLLVYLFFKRKHLQTRDLIAAGCWLPAILGGVWFHHYALAALPIAIGIHLLVTNWWKEMETDRVGFRFCFLRGSFVRLAAFVIVLLPGLTYWLPVDFVVGRIVSLGFFSFLSLFVAGNVAAFLIFLYELTREKRPGE
jgi:glycosyl transferase family 87